MKLQVRFRPVQNPGARNAKQRLQQRSVYSVRRKPGTVDLRNEHGEPQ